MGHASIRLTLPSGNGQGQEFGDPLLDANRRQELQHGKAASSPKKGASTGILLGEFCATVAWTACSSVPGLQRSASGESRLGVGLGLGNGD